MPAAKSAGLERQTAVRFPFFGKLGSGFSLSKPLRAFDSLFSAVALLTAKPRSSPNGGKKPVREQFLNKVYFRTGVLPGGATAPPSSRRDRKPSAGAVFANKNNLERTYPFFIYVVCPIRATLWHISSKASKAEPVYRLKYIAGTSSNVHTCSEWARCLVPPAPAYRMAVRPYIEFAEGKHIDINLSQEQTISIPA